MFRVFKPKPIITAAALIAALVPVWTDASAAAPKPKKPMPAEQTIQSDDALEIARSKLPDSAKAERLLARKSDDRAGHLQAAKAHLLEGAGTPSHVNAAQQHAMAVLAEHPNDVDALLLAGQTSILKGDAATAARYYQAATAADGNNANAFLGVGDALSRLGDEPGATAAFARYRSLMGMPPIQPVNAKN
jgi:predicted Zn-dependent protease